MKTNAFTFLVFLGLICNSNLLFSQVYSSISQRGLATTATSGSGKLTIDKPTGVVAGDVLIVSIVQNDATNNNLDVNASSTGWIIIDGRSIYDLNGSGGNPDKEWWGTLLYKVADGTEGNSFDFTLDSDAEMAIGSIIAFSGVDVTNGVKADGTAGGPFDVDPGTLNLTAVATATASAISNASSSAAIVMFAQVADNLTYSSWSATAPSSFTELYENTTANSDDASVGAAWGLKSSIGTTGSASVTLSATARNAATLIALKPKFYSALTNTSVISQRGLATTATSGSGKLTIDKPTGVVAGDVLIVSIVQNDATNNNLDVNASSTGWIIIDGRSIYDLNGSGGNPDKEWWGTLLYKVADGTEGNSFDFTLDSDAEMAIGSIIAFSGVDVTNGVKADGTAGGPFDVDPGTLNLTAVATATASAISNASSSAAIVMFAQVADNLTYSSWSATAPSSFTELYENTTANSDDASVGAAWGLKSSIGTTGSASVTLSATARNAATLIALKPKVNSPYKYFTGSYGATQNEANLTPVSIASKSIPLSASYFTSSNVKKVSIVFESSSNTISKIYADKDANGGLNVSGTTDFELGLNTDYFIDNLSGNLKKVTINLPVLTANGNLYKLFVESTASSVTFMDELNLAAAALPVTLSSFTAKPTPDNKVSLAWVTSTEQVNKGFRIERQAGNENGKFEQIAFVGSKAKDGNSQNMLTYNFIDAAPKVGAASFYRLVQEDLDGKLTYTEVRVVKLNGQSVSMVFPNPSNGAVNISRTADGKKMNIQVIDQSGKIISQVNNITDANYRMNIPQSGIYSIKMMYPETGEQSIQRIVVQK